MAELRSTGRTSLAAAAFVVLAILQVAVPVHAMFQPRPARFGWQMYSTVSPVPEVWTEDANGVRHAVDVLPLMGDARAEIVWAEPLARVLCADQEVRDVIVSERGRQQRFSCP